jgi:hypothetical protein
MAAPGDRHGGAVRHRQRAAEACWSPIYLGPWQSWHDTQLSQLYDTLLASTRPFTDSVRRS